MEHVSSGIWSDSHRNQVISANTLFKCVSYNPEESQIITSGSDRKIGYWKHMMDLKSVNWKAPYPDLSMAWIIANDGSSFATGG